MPECPKVDFSVSNIMAVRPASLMLMPPAFICLATARAESSSFPNTAAERPKEESLAHATASSMLSKAITGIIGPNVSSVISNME